jgi:hypothetical protein
MVGIPSMKIWWKNDIPKFTQTNAHLCGTRMHPYLPMHTPQRTVHAPKTKVVKASDQPTRPSDKAYVRPLRNIQAYSREYSKNMSITSDS